MNKKYLVAVLIAVVAFFGENPNPPNSNDEIFLYRAVEKVKPGHFPLNQGAYGTCVAFGHAAAVDARSALDKIEGRIRTWQPSSPDAIYAGSRNEAWERYSNSYGQGSSGIGAVKWLSKFGGVLYKQAYESFGIDLTSYEIPRCKDWGANGNGGRRDGIGGPFDVEAQKHKVKIVSRVSTLDELDVALKNGFPVTICSSQGFTSSRDADGFCQASGRWNHCMVVMGKRGEGRKGYLILNSWGRTWVSGPKYKDQPDGSFYCEPNVMARILKAGDSWAIGSVDGFKPSILPDWMLNPNAAIPDDFAEVKSNLPIVNPAVLIERAIAPQQCKDGKCNLQPQPTYRRFFR